MENGDLVFVKSGSRSTYPYFDAACERLGYDIVAMSRILNAYEEKGRHYHNMNHIESMLKAATCHAPDFLSLSDDFYAAVIYHDYHYAFTGVVQGENEGRSVLEFMTNDPRHCSEKAQRMIFASANHLGTQKAAEANAELGFFLDMDLSSFAQRWDAYKAEALQVMAEMEPYGTAEQRISGNLAFLRVLSNRPKIYYVMESWEAQARRNIEMRIEDLNWELLHLPYDKEAGK